MIASYHACYSWIGSGLLFYDPGTQYLRRTDFFRGGDVPTFKPPS